MATNKHSGKTYDSLAHAASVITASLTKKVVPNAFKSQEEVEGFVSSQFKRLMELGDYSYDPSLGEIIISFTPDLDVHKELPDERRVSTIVHDYFTAQGWQNVILIPGRTGAHKALVRLRHPTLLQLELTNPKGRVERAIESALTR
jgi:hypothetical protein